MKIAIITIIITTIIITIVKPLGTKKCFSFRSIA